MDVVMDIYVHTYRQCVVKETNWRRESEHMFVSECMEVEGISLTD